MGFLNFLLFLYSSLTFLKTSPCQSSSGNILFFNNSSAYCLANNLSASSLEPGFLWACYSNCLSRIGKNLARFKPYSILSWSLFYFILVIIARRNSRIIISLFVNLFAWNHSLILKQISGHLFDFLLQSRSQCSREYLTTLY